MNHGSKWLILATFFFIPFATTADDDISQADLEKVVVSVCQAVEFALLAQPGTVTSIELEHDQGALIYEVEVMVEGKEIEVTVNAQTGETRTAVDD
ncbi:MAG: PepSY domain-containing protein [Acidobacteria bacterium]|nr:PepSY domain-containing protein [Acidobacteriota bacterium]